MNDLVSSGPQSVRSSRPGQVRFVLQLALVLGAWIASAVVLSTLDLLDTEILGFPLLVVASVVVPPLVFLACYARYRALRERVLSLDPVMVTFFQIARILGLVFLVLYTVDILPPAFALAAGSGDMAIGLTAPFVAFGLMALSPFPKRAYVAWHVAGTLDLVMAVTLGVLSSPTAAGVLVNHKTTEVVMDFPLAFIPAFGVPLALIMHAIALLQVRTGRHIGGAPLLRPGTAEGTSPGAS